jgi:hypothetical protein
MSKVLICVEDSLLSNLVLLLENLHEFVIIIPAEICQSYWIYIILKPILFCYAQALFLKVGIVSGVVVFVVPLRDLTIVAQIQRVSKLYISQFKCLRCRFDTKC